MDPKWPKRLKAECGLAPAATLAWLSTFLLMVYALLSFMVLSHEYSKLQAVSDLAALAASDAIKLNPANAPAACYLAQNIAAANQTKLTNCRFENLNAHITLSKEVNVIMGFSLQLEASAKAGPPPNNRG